jgi:hypothetical protein
VRNPLITTTETLGIYTRTDGRTWTSHELPVPQGTVRLINGDLHLGSRSEFDICVEWPTFDKKGKHIPPEPKKVTVYWQPLTLRKPSLFARWFGGGK